MIYKVSEVKMIYKTKYKPEHKISASNIAFKIFKPFFEEIIEYKERFYVMYLNKANKVLGVHKISSGGTSATIVDVKHIAQGAILSNASAIILAHNHPSGNLQPSQSDKVLTKKTKEGLALLDIETLDHLIITSEGYYSFSDEGII